MMKIERGARVRVLAQLESNQSVDSFRTTHIEGGLRMGTIVCTVLGTCAGGCHVVVRDPFGEESVFTVEMLRPLDEDEREDSDGAEGSEQHASVGEGQHVQGLPGTPRGPEGGRALPFPVPAQTQTRERASEDLMQAVMALRRVWQAIQLAEEPGSGYGIAHVRNTFLDAFRLPAVIEHMEKDR